MTCEGCHHIRNADDFEGFCYMFDKEPEVLPCGQHDKYKAIRKATGKMLLKNPFLFHLWLNQTRDKEGEVIIPDKIKEARDAMSENARVSKGIMMTREQALLGDARQPMNRVVINKHRSDERSGSMNRETNDD